MSCSKLVDLSQTANQTYSDFIQHLHREFLGVELAP